MTNMQTAESAGRAIKTGVADRGRERHSGRHSRTCWPVIRRSAVSLLTSALAIVLPSTACEASVTLTVERLNPAIHGGPTPPSNLIVVDVMADLSPDDDWSTGGIAGSVTGVGSRIVYRSVAGQPVLVDPGSATPFVTCFSRPKPRTSAGRFNAGEAVVLGGYSPPHPYPPTADTARLNVAFGTLAAPAPGADGAIVRLVLDVAAAPVDSATVVVSTIPIPGWIRIFSSIGAGNDLGTVSLSANQPGTYRGLNWGLWGHPSALAADFNHDGAVTPLDVSDFTIAFDVSIRYQFNGADMDNDGDTDCDDLAIFEWSYGQATGDPAFRVPLAPIDGYWDGSFFPLLAVQNNQTSFGNSTTGAVDLANGSELDAVYGRVVCDRLYLLLAGNLKSDGTHLELFFDTSPGGQNRLRGNNANVDSNGLNRLGDSGVGNGLTFDADFAPDYYLTFSGDTSLGSYRLGAWYATLPTGGGGTGGALGLTPAGIDGLPTSGLNATVGLRATIDNANIAGVPAGSGQGYGDGVQSGIELSLPLSAIGNPSCGFRVAAFITSPARDIVSNQVLGGLGGGFGSLGEPRTVNLASIARIQSFPGSTGFSDVTQILAPDGAAGDGLKPVALSNTDLVAGAPEHDPSGIAGAGAVYVYQPVSNIWTNRQEITAFDASSNDKFGSSIAIAGSFLVVGAPQDDDRGAQSGSVYVYRKLGDGSWGSPQKLTATDGSSNDNFGTSVAAYGTSIVIGAPGADGAQPAAGASYVFELQPDNQFAQVAKLYTTDGQTGDGFGTVVGLYSTYAIIGAELDDNSAGVDAGAAYIFRKSSTWGAASYLSLQPAGLVAGAKFGRTVAIDGSYAAVGAPFQGNGTAFVFQRAGFAWPLSATLTAPDGATGDAFGTAAAMKGDKLIIGASGDDVPHFNEGSAYLFQRGAAGWQLVSKLLSPEGRAGDNFGGVGGAAVSGGLVVVSAGGADPGGNLSQGAASLFTLGLSSPSILADPFDADLCVGQVAQFSTLAVSSTAVTYAWRKDGMTLVDGVTPRGSTIAGATAAMLTVTTVAPGDQGEYDCVVTNACGAATSNPATLTVSAPATIVQQPSTVSTCGTGSVMFSVDAAGAGPLSFQWEWRQGAGPWTAMVDGVNSEPTSQPLFVATGAHSASVTISPPGVFASYPPVLVSTPLGVRCMAANTCGTSASNAATLTIRPADFNCSGGPPTVQDIFDFLAAYFAGDPRADFNHSGMVTVQDIFDFLASYFA